MTLNQKCKLLKLPYDGKYFNRFQLSEQRYIFHQILMNMESKLSLQRLSQLREIREKHKLFSFLPIYVKVVIYSISQWDWDLILYDVSLQCFDLLLIHRTVLVNLLNQETDTTEYKTEPQISNNRYDETQSCFKG